MAKKVKTLSATYSDLRQYFSETVESKIKRHLTEFKVRFPLTSQDMIRVSSLPYLCPREEALAARDQVTRTDKINSQLRSIFETGNAYQEIIRDKVFAQDAFLIGMWECQSCRYVHGAIQGQSYLNDKGVKEAKILKRIPMPKVCQHVVRGFGECPGDKFQYIEETVTNHHLRFEGHPDGIVVSRLYDHVLEIKTVNEFRYKVAKSKPFKEHLEQAMVYAWMTHKKRILLLYCNKNTGAFCTWDLPIDPIILKDSIKKLKDTWDAIMELEQTGKITTLPQRICKTPTEARAKKCELCTACFSSP